MNSSPRSLPYSLAAFAVAGLSLLTVRPVEAQSITIPNYSFEGPVVPPDSVTGVLSTITNWTMTPEPGYYSSLPFEVTGGYPWAFLSGVFANTPPESVSNHITNLDGNQAALLFGYPDLGIYQTLSTVYEAGKDYHLTLGLVGLGGGMPENVPFGLQLYYLDAGNKVILGTQTVLHTAANFPNHTQVFDFTLDLAAATVQSAGAVGQQIGIQLITNSTFGVDPAGGYWDADNVRLTATPAPEPGSALLLGCGGMALLLRRRSTRMA